MKSQVKSTADEDVTGSVVMADIIDKCNIISSVILPLCGEFPPEADPPLAEEGVDLIYPPFPSLTKGGSFII